MAKRRGGGLRLATTRQQLKATGAILAVTAAAVAGGLFYQDQQSAEAVANSTSSYVVPEYVPPAPKPFAAFLGDSYTAGARAEGEQNRYTAIVCDAKQWRCAINGQGGTGFTNPGPGDQGETVFLDRVEALGRNGTPAVIVVQGGTNDSGDAPAVRAAAEQVFTAVQAQYPEARVLAIGPTAPPAFDAARMSANRDAIRDAAQANGIQFVDPIAENWIPDNALYSDDETHLGPAGYKIYADRVLAALS